MGEAEEREAAVAAQTPQNKDGGASDRDKSWTAPFFTIWIGQALSLIGSSVGGFALVWWITQASGGSATVLATASVFAYLPQVLVGPLAGALIDRWSRRRVMMIADSLVAAFSAVLAVLAWTGQLAVWHTYVIMFIRSLGGTFHWAAMKASTALMVPDDQLARVSGMDQALQGALAIITPPLGALALSLMTLQGIMAVDVATAAFAIVPLFFVLIPDPTTRTVAQHQSVVGGVLQDTMDGFRFMWKWSGMFLILVIAALLNGTINPAFALMPILVTDTFGGGALQLAWTQSAWGIGMVLGGLILSVWGGFRRKLLTSLLGLIVAGVAFAGVGLVPPTGFVWAIVGIFVAGTMNPLINGPFFAIVQSVVPPELHGRVFSVIMSVSGMAAPVGIAIAGPLSDAFGVQVWFLVGGFTSLLMGVGCRAIPAIMRLEDQGREYAARIAAQAQVDGVREATAD